MRVCRGPERLYLDTIADSEDQQPAIPRPESYPVRTPNATEPWPYRRRTASVCQAYQNTKRSCYLG